MRVSNEDGSAAGINRCNTAPSPTGFAEFVGDCFPILRKGAASPTLIIEQAARLAVETHVSDDQVALEQRRVWKNNCATRHAESSLIT
jgi:hypothetical protein